jgi:hypothetical protein
MAKTEKLLLDIQVKNLQALGRVEQSINKLSVSSKGFGLNLKTAVTALGAIATGRIAKGIIETTARFQDLRTTLASTTGSARAGAEAFKFISDFATRTQFGVEDLTTTFIKLKTAGIEPTEELLTTFTDAAAVTTDQIGSLEAITDLFARTVSGGLGLEELNRLADRGIPVFRILEEELGITRLQISNFGRTAEGARKITDALGKGIRENFGGATQNLLGNLSVSFSNFGIQVKTAADIFGQGLAPVIRDTTDDITAFIKANEENIKRLGAGFGIVSKTIVENIELISAAFLLLSFRFSKTPLGKIISGILLLGQGSLYLLKQLEKLNPELAKTLREIIGLEKFKETIDDVLQLEDQTNAFNDELRRFSTRAKEARQVTVDLNKALKDAFLGEVATGIEGYTKNLEELINTYRLSSIITDTATKATRTFATTTESALTDVVMGTKTLQQALGEIGQAIIRDLIGGFIRLLIVGPILDLIARKLGLQQTDQLNRERQIEASLKRQIGYRLILAAITGGFGFANGGAVGYANGGAIGYGGARAGGGSVNNSNAFLVGERGPELFVPNSAGTIIPSERLGSGMGEVTVNLNINAVDAASFDDLLLSRKNLIVGTIQQAFRQQGRRLA